MISILEKYALSNNIVFDVDYRRGSIVDRSPYKTAVTATADGNWVRTKLGHGLMFKGTGALSYADHSAIRLVNSDATFVWFGKFDDHTLNKCLVHKGDAGGTSYTIYTNNTTPNRLTIWNGTALRHFDASIVGRSFIAISFVNNAIPNLYLDGTFVASGNGTQTIANDDAPLLIGNFSTGTGPCKNPLHRITIINKALSANEISQLYTELTSERFPLRAYSFGSRMEAPKDPPGVTALLKTDFTTKLPDGRLADLSGNGWHGTIKPGFVAGKGMCGNALVANSTTRSYVDFGDVTPVNSASKLTVLWYGKRGPCNPAEFIYAKTQDANNRSYITLTTAEVRFVCGANKPAPYADTNLNTDCFVGFVYNGSLSNDNKVKFYVDNKPCAATVAADFPTTLPNATGVSLECGRLWWSDTYPPAQKNDFFTVYNADLTSDQVSYVYRQIAARSTFSLDMQRVPVSLANLVGPCEVPGTPFRLQTGGTWKVSEDGYGKHWFETVATNNKSCYMSSTQAYGTYVFDIYHTGVEYLIPFSNVIDIVDAARNNYAIILNGTTVDLYKYGANVTLFSAANSVTLNTSYSIAFTRSSSGTWTIYIKGGTYKSWTLLTATSGTNPVVDNAYQNAKYCILASSTSSGGKFSQPRFFQGVLTIDQLNSLCP